MKFGEEVEDNGARLGRFSFALVALGMSVGGVALAMVMYQSKKSASAVQLRWRFGGGLVESMPLQRNHYHVFVSHNWSSAQDQARIVKAGLTRIVPGLTVWLDVDDHPSKSGIPHPTAKAPHEFVAFSRAMVAFLAGETLADGRPIS